MGSQYIKQEKTELRSSWHWCWQRALSPRRSVRAPPPPPKKEKTSKERSLNITAVALSLSNKASCAVGRAHVICYSKGTIVCKCVFPNQSSSTVQQLLLFALQCVLLYGREKGGVVVAPVTGQSSQPLLADCAKGWHEVSGV